MYTWGNKLRTKWASLSIKWLTKCKVVVKHQIVLISNVVKTLMIMTMYMDERDENKVALENLTDMEQN